MVVTSSHLRDRSTSSLPSVTLGGGESLPWGGSEDLGQSMRRTVTSRSGRRTAGRDIRRKNTRKGGGSIVKYGSNEFDMEAVKARMSIMGRKGGDVDFAGTQEREEISYEYKVKEAAARSSKGAEEKQFSGEMAQEEVRDAAVKVGKGCWQFVGRQEKDLEMPVMRGMIKGLEQEWKRVVGGGKIGEMEGVRGEVERWYRERKALWEISERGRNRVGGKGQGGGTSGMLKLTRPFEKGERPSSPPLSYSFGTPLAPTSDLPTTSSLSSSDMVPPPLLSYFSESDVTFAYMASARERLSMSLYVQKWCDLMCNDLATQVGVSCMEHGRLLRDIRTKYGEAFEAVATLHKDAVDQLDKVSEGLIRAWRRLDGAEVRWADREELLRKDAEEKIGDVERNFEIEYKATAKVSFVNRINLSH